MQKSLRIEYQLQHFPSGIHARKFPVSPEARGGVHFEDYSPGFFQGLGKIGRQDIDSADSQSEFFRDFDTRLPGFGMQQWGNVPGGAPGSQIRVSSQPEAGSIGQNAFGRISLLADEIPEFPVDRDQGKRRFVSVSPERIAFVFVPDQRFDGRFPVAGHRRGNPL